MNGWKVSEIHDAFVLKFLNLKKKISGKFCWKLVFFFLQSELHWSCVINELNNWLCVTRAIGACVAGGQTFLSLPKLCVWIMVDDKSVILTCAQLPDACNVVYTKVSQGVTHAWYHFDESFNSTFCIAFNEDKGRWEIRDFCKQPPRVVGKAQPIFSSGSIFFMSTIVNFQLTIILLLSNWNKPGADGWFREEEPSR